MSWNPSFKLYQSNGSTLVYYVENVISTNYPEDNPSSVMLTNLRSSKGIIIPGGDKPWDLTMRCLLIGTNYIDLQGKINTLKSSILSNTPYVLKIEMSPGAYDTINVTRVNSIIFEEGRRVKFQYFILNLLASSW